MPVTPNALFEAAREIGQGKSEVDLRNATSRAYYAAYHRCRLLAENLPALAGHQGGVHRFVIDTLTENKSWKLKSLGYMLDQCRKLRVEADYDIKSEFQHQDAHNVLAVSEKILKKADSIPSRSVGGP